MAMLLLPSFLCFIFLFGFAKSSFDPRIGRGIPMPSDNFLNFTVKIYAGDYYWSGTIISKRHILTAMAVIGDGSKAKSVKTVGNYKVVTDKFYFTQVGGEKITTDTAYVPIEFPETSPADIAVWEFPEGTNILKYSVNNSPKDIFPVTLGKDYVEKEGDIVTIAGYGRSSDENDKQLPQQDLLYQNVSINMEGFGGYMVQLGNKTHRPLVGDTGAPTLVYKNNKWYQIGITSYYGDAGAYSVRTSSFCNFIEEITKKEVLCKTMYPKRPAIPSFPPIYNGPSTPKELFDFVIPLHPYSFTGDDHHRGCTATIISPRHLLTSANCFYKDLFPFPTEKDYYKAVNHTFFADFRSKSVQKINEPVAAMAKLLIGQRVILQLLSIQKALTLELNLSPLIKPTLKSMVKSILLLVMVDIQLKIKSITLMFLRLFNKCKFQLLRKKTVLIDGVNFYQPQTFSGYEIMLDESPLIGDEGGPALIERHGKFYQVGIASLVKFENDFRTRVSHHCDFIATVTKNAVKCESIFELKLKPAPEAAPRPSTSYDSSASTNFESNIALTVAILKLSWKMFE